MIPQNVPCRCICHSKWKHLLLYYLQNSTDWFGFDAPTGGSENSFTSQVPADKWMMQRASFVQEGPRDSGECPECEEGTMCATAASLSSASNDVIWIAWHSLVIPPTGSGTVKLTDRSKQPGPGAKLPGASVRRSSPSAEGRQQRSLHRDVIQLRFKYQNPARKA